MATKVAVKGLIVAVVGLGLAGAVWLRGWWSTPAGVLLGVLAAAAWFHLRHWCAMDRIAASMRAIECGDLSGTVPEVGAAPLPEIARGVNAMAVDFQEVLLLFANLVQSTRASAQLLRCQMSVHGTAAVDHAQVRRILDEIDEMEEMISDFKYFRVRLEDGLIIDSGVGSKRVNRVLALTPSPEPGRDTADGDGAVLQREIQDEEAAPTVAGDSRPARG